MTDPVSEATQPADGLPRPLDCETLALFRSFLVPILESASDWRTLVDQLARKGYRLAFREGHLVILDDSGRPLCTGKTLGVPLYRLAARIGRPCIRADCSGHAGELL